MGARSHFSIKKHFLAVKSHDLEEPLDNFFSFQVSKSLKLGKTFPNLTSLYCGGCIALFFYFFLIKLSMSSIKKSYICQCVEDEKQKAIIIIIFKNTDTKMDTCLYFYGKQLCY